MKQPRQSIMHIITIIPISIQGLPLKHGSI
jgi:hypothetical protein